MTSQEFIENAPLYTRVEIQSFTPPESVTRMCMDKRCRRETTWTKMATGRNILKGGTPEIQIEYVSYMCVLCRCSNFAVMYELLNWSENPRASNHWRHTAVRKVGQMPPLDITIPPDLSDRLGTTADHYRKALICRGSSYGIAAMAYLRRVVDEKTDELIDTMAELSRGFNVDETTINELLNAKSETQYLNKLKVAADLIPNAVRPGGVNPLGQLYKHTSIGLHGKTDDECVAIFDDLKADFEYVFRNLHTRAEEQREFAKRVQERAGRSLTARTETTAT